MKRVRRWFKIYFVMILLSTATLIAAYYLSIAHDMARAAFFTGLGIGFFILAVFAILVTIGKLIKTRYRGNRRR